MKEINEKIQELLLVSKRTTNGWAGMEKKMKHQDKLMDELKELAKGISTPLGRIIKFQMADSYAYYIITNLLKTKVEVTNVLYCDEWIDSRLGKRGYLDYDYVTSYIDAEDYRDAMYEKHLNKEHFLNV